MIGEGRLQHAPVRPSRRLSSIRYRGAGDGRAAPSAGAVAAVLATRIRQSAVGHSGFRQSGSGQHVRQLTDAVSRSTRNASSSVSWSTWRLRLRGDRPQLRRRFEGQLIAEATSCKSCRARSSRRTNDGEMPPAGRYSRDALDHRQARRRRARREWRSMNACRPRH